MPALRDSLLVRGRADLGKYVVSVTGSNYGGNRLMVSGRGEENAGVGWSGGGVALIFLQAAACFLVFDKTILYVCRFCIFSQN